MAKERNYFTFYRSFYEQIQSCEDKDVRLEMYEVFLDYAFNKKEPDFKKGRYSELTRFFWMGAKPVLDKNWKRFDNGNKPKANGKQNTSKSKATPSIDKDKLVYTNLENKDKLVYTNLENKDKLVYTNLENKEGEIEEGVFCPPALEDVLCYYLSTHGTEIDDGIAKKFISYYTARDWMMGKTPMADWRAAFESWCIKEQEFNHKHNRYNENNKPTTEQCDAELGRREQLNHESIGNGEGAGIDEEAW